MKIPLNFLFKKGHKTFCVHGHMFFKIGRIDMSDFTAACFTQRSVTHFQERAFCHLLHTVHELQQLVSNTQDSREINRRHPTHHL